MLSALLVQVSRDELSGSCFQAYILAFFWGAGGRGGGGGGERGREPAHVLEHLIAADNIPF